ncbi:MAG: hypothetical protein WC773_01455 [Patescibacteria group bacterium]|jgi:hypothetical protein
MRHAQGGKIRGKHTSIIDEAESLIKAVDGLACVTGVSLGFIQHTKGRPVPKNLKFLDVDAGLQLTVRAPKTVQTLIVYTSDRTGTAKALCEAFYKK